MMEKFMKWSFYLNIIKGLEQRIYKKICIGTFIMIKIEQLA